MPITRPQLPSLEAAQPLTPYLATVGGKPVSGGLGVGVVSDQSGDDTTADGASLATLRKWFRSHQDNKIEEMKESRVARQYYHADQWTREEMRKLTERNQPPIVINRTGRKIDGLVGLVERMRQDPKAFPRTPAHIAGADLATAVLRFVMDANQWLDLSNKVAHDMAVSGYGGVEFDTEPTDDGSQDVTMEPVEPETFFYDPRSIKPDFRDVRFMGVAKWLDLDTAIELFPDQAETLRTSMAAYGREGDVQGLRDWEKKWFDSKLNRVLIIHTCYRWDNQWWECVHTGYTKLASGISRFQDEKGKTLCRFMMASCSIDHEGDRYGFVRNLRGPQDEINHRRSKLLHMLHSRTVIAEDGVVADIEKAKRQIGMRDPWIELLPGASQRRFEIMDESISLQGQKELLAEAKQEIEAFGGVNPALAGGQGQENRSGRAIALMQQAGVAEAGPFLSSFRAWKLRCYRMTWQIIRNVWTTPRYIRLTDDPDEIQMIMVNQPMQNAYGLPALGPDGQPMLKNNIGQLDVDIIIDEGPDTVTLREDVRNDIKDMVAAKMLPPAAYLAVADLPPAEKKIVDSVINQPPDPQAAQMQAAQQHFALANMDAQVRATNARAMKDEAAAGKTAIDAHLRPMEAAASVQQQLQSGDQGMPIGEPSDQQPAPPPPNNTQGVVKRVIRGPDGRPVGIEKLSANGEVISRERIIRDGAGSIVGTEEIR